MSYSEPRVSVQIILASGSAFIHQFMSRGLLTNIGDVTADELQDTYRLTVLNKLREMHANRGVSESSSVTLSQAIELLKSISYDAGNARLTKDNESNKRLTAFGYALIAGLKDQGVPVEVLQDAFDHPDNPVDITGISLPEARPTARPRPHPLEPWRRRVARTGPGTLAGAPELSGVLHEAETSYAQRWKELADHTRISLHDLTGTDSPTPFMGDDEKGFDRGLNSVGTRLNELGIPAQEGTPVGILVGQIIELHESIRMLREVREEIDQTPPADPDLVAQFKAMLAQFEGPAGGASKA